MKTLLRIVPLMAFVFSINVFAHGGGHQPITEAQAIEAGVMVTKELTTYDAGLGFGQLPESWKNVATKSAAIHKKERGYYIVSVTNPDEKKTLYILMSISGEAYDANFTGEFPKLK